MGDIKNELSFLCLNDDVLLNVFSYLTLKESINLAATCERLQQLAYWVFNKYELEFCRSYWYDLRRKQKHFLEKEHLKFIGPYIHIISIDLCELNKEVMDNCTRVTSLRLYSNDSNILSLQRVCECNKWIKQLKLDCLWLINVKYTNELLDEVTNLKELRLDPDTKYLKNLLERNSTVERLSISAVRSFNFSVLRRLQHLRCLHVTIDDRDLMKLIQFGKLNGVSELSVCFWYSSRWKKQEPIRLDTLNAFLGSLSNVMKLDKLNLMLPWYLLPNENTFRALKSLNLSTLGLHMRNQWNLPLDNFTRFIQYYTVLTIPVLILTTLTTFSYALCILIFLDQSRELIL